METDYRTAAPTPADPTLPRVSVLVMGHNQQDFMAACVDSVLSQQYDGWVEVVLCDDCSTDATYDIMLQKAREYRGPFRVIAHRCPVNGRVAVNMNIAVSLSEGDWLMRVDGDDIMHPDRLRLSIDALRKHPDAVGVAGQYRYFNDTYEPVVNPADADLEYGVYSRADFVPDKAAGLEWWGGIMTFSRKLFTEFGDMPVCCDVLDDTMFMTRALMLGKFVIVRNACFIYYRRHGDNVSSGREGRVSLWMALSTDVAMRSYYRRGIPCHAPILAELRARAQQDASCVPMFRWFERHFAELKRQAFFWRKSWRERIADGRITGPWWRKIPWVIRVSCPLAFVLGERLSRWRS